jgi:hypothetical protein
MDEDDLSNDKCQFEKIYLLLDFIQRRRRAWGLLF